MEAYLKALELGKPMKLINLKLQKRTKIFLSATFFFLAAKSQYKQYLQNCEITLKKKRLSLPIYTLSDSEMTNPPWVQNYNAWKYRRVRLKGRYIHGQSIYLPKKVHGYRGYYFVLPAVTSEDKKLENRNGMLICKGWIPHEYKKEAHRHRYENSFVYETIDGVVTKGEDLDTRIFFKKGNAVDEQRWIVNNLDLRFIARATGFLNQETTRSAVVEILDQEGTDIDETDPMHFRRDLSGTETFPYPRTYSGFLQGGDSQFSVDKWKFFYGLMGVTSLLL